MFEFPFPFENNIDPIPSILALTLCLLSISLYDDFWSSHKNSLMLTCITRRFSLIYLLHAFHDPFAQLLFYISNWEETICTHHVISISHISSSEFRFITTIASIYMLYVFFTQYISPNSTSLLTTTTTTTCNHKWIYWRTYSKFLAFLYPFLCYLLLYILYSWKVLIYLELITILFTLQIVVMIGFWFGVFFLNACDESSILLQKIYLEPFEIFSNLKTVTILIDHGGYNILICYLIWYQLKNYNLIVTHLNIYNFVENQNQVSFSRIEWNFVPLRSFLTLNIFWITYAVLIKINQMIRKEIATQNISLFLNQKKEFTSQNKQKIEIKNIFSSSILNELKLFKKEFLWQMRQHIYSLYHFSGAPENLNVTRIQRLLQNRFCIEEYNQVTPQIQIHLKCEHGVQSLIQGLQIGECNSKKINMKNSILDGKQEFINYWCQNSQTLFEFLIMYEYLATYLPYDILYPKYSIMGNIIYWNRLTKIAIGLTLLLNITLFLIICIN